MLSRVFLPSMECVGWYSPAERLIAGQADYCTIGDIGFKLLCRYLEELIIVDKPCAVSHCPDTFAGGCGAATWRS